MSNHLRLKLLVAAVGMATATATTAANTQTLRAQNLGAVPVSSLAMHLNLGQDMPLAPQSSSALANGQHVVRQQQMYRGVPVYGRSIGVVQDGAGNALRATGELLQASALSLPSVSPRLSPAAAINALRSHVHTTLIAGTTLTNSKSDLFVYPQDNGPTLLAATRKPASTTTVRITPRSTSPSRAAPATCRTLTSKPTTCTAPAVAARWSASPAPPATRTPSMARTHQ